MARKADKAAIADYYSKGFSVEQAAAKFGVGTSLVSKIVEESGIKRSAAAEAEDRRRRLSRRRRSRKPTDTRIVAIRRIFDECGCSERFELADVIDRTHIAINCLACGNRFTRETSFLETSRVDANIGCPACGMHADGTISHVRGYKSRIK